MSWHSPKGEEMTGARQCAVSRAAVNTVNRTCEENKAHLSRHQLRVAEPDELRGSRLLLRQLFSNQYPIAGRQGRISLEINRFPMTKGSLARNSSAAWR